MKKTICLALVAVLGGSAPPAAAVPLAERVQVMDRLRATDAYSAPLAPALERLRRLGLPQEILDLVLRRDQESFGGTFGWARNANDLDGDARRDLFLIAIRYRVTIGGGLPMLVPQVDFDATSKLTAISGLSGEVLWHKTFDDLVVPVPARVGHEARHGAIIVSGAVSLLGPVGDYRVGIAALEGASGDRIWRRRYKATVVETYPAYVVKDAPLAIEIFDGLDGPATDVLVSVGDFNAAHGAYTVQSQASVIDGHTGQDRVHPARDVGVGWYALPWAVGDLDGDGSDDYIVTDAVSVGHGFGITSPGSGEARRGMDGSEIWSQSGFEFGDFAWPQRLRDVDGDGGDDVVIITEPHEGRDLHTYLLEGATGRRHWHGRGGFAYSPGDIDRDGVRDVVFRDATLRFRRRTSTIRVRAVNYRGKELWHRVHRSRFQRHECSSQDCLAMIMAGWSTIGDLQPDGLDDMVVYHARDLDPGPEQAVTYTVDGGTGRRLITGGSELHALGGALDGRGTDLAYADATRRRLQITARQGSGQELLWEATVDPRSPIKPALGAIWLSALSLGSDRCADVLVTLGWRRNDAVVALDGSDGSLLWARTFSGDSVDVRTTTGVDRNAAC